MYAYVYKSMCKSRKRLNKRGKSVDINLMDYIFLSEGDGKIMAKKAPVKKTKRRLKRSVRRSLAAVLMVTSIAVAAIPVPENYADNGDARDAAGMARAADVHDLDDYGYDGDTAPEETLPGSPGTNFYLGKYAGKEDEEILKDLDSSVWASYAVTDLGGGTYSLGWQFLFYRVTNPRGGGEAGVVCKYNREFYSEKVDLSLYPTTKYFTFEAADYDAYYTGTMDNAKRKLMDATDPLQSVEYTYRMYKAGGLDDETRNFFTKYFEKDLQDKEKAFQDYKTREDAYNKNPGTAPNPGPEPSALSKVPANDLSAAQKLQYFCEHNLQLKRAGSNYTLFSVKDGRPKTLNSGGDVYLAKDGTPATGYANDGNGFLVLETNPYTMCAIGNEAFKGVTNVENMEIPQQIGYIGNEAFADATLLSSIKLNNVDVIGNRAFNGCVNLATADLGQTTKVIGKECFSGTRLTSIKFNNATETIGYGAFYNCRYLTTVIFENGGQPCTIKDYAFFNCPALTTVSMEGTNIVGIGDGAFAVETGSQPMKFVLPFTLTEEKGLLGNYLFAGRSSLESVKFPKDYGRSKETKLPDAMFHGCSNLKYVEFPCDPKNDPLACGFVSYNPAKLFADVTNPDFYVMGPKLNNRGEAALPRSSTWDAETAVSKTIPYVYVENGVNFYEVSDGTYLLCIDDKGVLVSCTFKPGATKPSTPNIDLEIPALVGNTKVTGIASGCFSDLDLNESVVSLKISDDSITSIADGVFEASETADGKRPWKNLKKVYIGNSVTSIGANAFKNCENLIDVTFNSPSAGHEAFQIGQDAFKTESEELTFHGDIAKGYAPFDWATDPNNIIKTAEGIRVCYKSLAPDYLTVMYNPITQMVTLLDYPKYDQIDDILTAAHADELKKLSIKSYKQFRESYLYEQYSVEDYDSKRVAFANAWNNAQDEDAKNELYASENYGPWVNPNFCGEWHDWLDGNPHISTPTPPVTGTSSAGTTTGGDSPDPDASAVDTIADFLFKPIVAYAADMQPYYSKNPYNVLKNIESNNPYCPSTPEEIELVNAIRNVVIPTGVDSIDVYGYVNNLTSDGEKYSGSAGNNTGNYSKYFNLRTWDSATHRMYTSRQKDDDDSNTIVPGLFSGYYEDQFEPVDASNELFKRGNDRIESITLGSVKYLPDYAFDSCERLRTVILGPDCADIGTAPFRGCHSMSAVGDNDYYKTQNGIVYSVNTDGTYTIEECLAARGRLVGTALIPDQGDEYLSKVSAIKPGAFEDCDHITTVDLSRTSGLTVIPKDCFRNDPTKTNCGTLTMVTLPRTVNEIQAGAFANALNLGELTIPGMEVFISASAFEDNDDRDNAKGVTRVRTYQDSSARRYVATYGDSEKYNLQWSDIGNQWRVTFYDADGVILKDLKNQDGEAIDNPQYVEDDAYAKLPTDPVKDGWTFDGWLGTDNTKVSDRIHGDTNFIAQGHNNNGSVGGRFVVEFYDGLDGKMLSGRGAEKDGKYYVDDGKSFAEMGYEAPTFPAHDNAANPRWSENWTTETKVTSNLTIVALYSSTTSGGGGTNTSGNTTNTPNTSGNTTNNNNTSNRSTSTTSTSNTSSSTSSSSTSTSSTTSDGRSVAMYTVLVQNGSGSGSYAQGATVVISAYPPAEGMVFSKWTTESTGVVLASDSTPVTTFVMPGNNVTITANYVAGTAPAANTAGTTGTTPVNNGNTTVDITKPGISNKDLATANVNGSTDNFIVKISETDAATQAVSAALTNKYGNLENILYYAMDITLWDSTGTYQLTGDQVAGLSVDITIPIPDALVAYGGNNMAGAVVNGDQLENLNESFTTINGVPCIRFTATHFSPYTIYVDTGNLTEGMLDVTPKTGDPIHPKWFLSIGLACLSIALFMKKDKKVKTKTA